MSGLLDLIDSGGISSADLSQSALVNLLASELTVTERLSRRFAAIEEEEKLFYRSPAVTIVHVRLSPNVVFPPHNHNMFAAIGIYEGEETHIGYRFGDGKLEVLGEQSFVAGEIVETTPATIHSVANQSSKRSAALHIYFGDLIAEPRSIWHPISGDEVPYSDEMYFAWAGPYDPSKPFSQPALCTAHS